MTERHLGFDVVVVGGGITGLAAAHRLVTAGATVAIVEESPRLGGKVVTEHHDGFLIEGGPDSFVSGKGAVLELARDLGLENEVISSRPEHRGSFVWWRGRLHPLPGGLLLMAPSRIRPLMTSSLLSWRGKLRVLSDLVLPRAHHDGDESLESFVTRRLGREVLERIAEPLIAGIHAAEPATMSLRAGFPRFPQMERDHRSLILAARAAAARPISGNGMSYFASFRNGMGTLTAALERALGGVDVRTGAGVVRLAGPDEGRYRLEMKDGSELSARSVIFATPARVTSELLSAIEPAAARAISGIRQVATSTVTLAYRATELPPLRGSGFVVPSVEGRQIMGASYLSQKWVGRVPDPSFVLVRVFVGGRSGQELATAEADRLLIAVRAELSALAGINAPPVLSRIHIWDGGLHQYTLGHLDRVAAAEAALSSHPRLALAGAAFHGIGLNECVSSGRRAAETVLAVGAAPEASRSPIQFLSNDGGSN